MAFQADVGISEDQGRNVLDKGRPLACTSPAVGREVPCNLVAREAQGIFYGQVGNGLDMEWNSVGMTWTDGRLLQCSLPAVEDLGTIAH